MVYRKLGLFIIRGDSDLFDSSSILNLYRKERIEIMGLSRRKFRFNYHVTVKHLNSDGTIARTAKELTELRIYISK